MVKASGKPQERTGDIIRLFTQFYTERSARLVLQDPFKGMVAWKNSMKRANLGLLDRFEKTQNPNINS